MNTLRTKINGCFVLTYPVFRDYRGLFCVPYNKEDLKRDIGEDIEFIQDNFSVSSYGVIRGLHFQEGEYQQSKLVRCVNGSINDIIVDIRPDSSTFGQVIIVPLCGNKTDMVFIPKGCAHGFAALEDNTIVEYKVDAPYNKESESGILYNDPYLNINWGISMSDAIVSDKDLKLPSFNQKFGFINNF